MLTILLIAFGLLLILLTLIPHAWLSIYQTLTDAPQRLLDCLAERKTRRDGKRRDRARRALVKGILDQIRRGDL